MLKPGDRRYGVAVMFLGTAMLLTPCTAAAQDAPATARTPVGLKVLFDFEDEADVKAWANVDVHALREAEAKAAYDAAVKTAADPAKLPPYKPLVQPPKEPPVRIERTAEGATRGKRALKLTFAGGQFPTISTRSPLEDWRGYNTFQADVTADRTCLVVFRVMSETSKYGRGYNESCSRWEFAARVEAGKSTVTTEAPKRLWDYIYNRNVRTVQIYIYQPQKGESITIDNIRLSTERPKSTSAYHDSPPWPKEGFKVAGTDLVVKNAEDLGDKLKLKDTWVKPEEKTVEQVETEVRAQFEKIKKDHPRAVLAMLRQGQKGYDQADPDKEFAGWKNGYGSCHGPMALNMACFDNRGKVQHCEASPRSRPSYHRVDLSSIPKGADILAARLIVVNAAPALEEPPWTNWKTKPTLAVTEPINRPWKEYEVNVFRYAKGKFWKDFAAMSWGEDGDCGAIYLSYGPGNGKAHSWDFTHAVRYWTEGKHPNHGFIISQPSKYHYVLSIFTYRCRDLKNRPCVAVIYEPKEKT